jgi:NAD(P)-dependent dehydrogenase (short-subunit alcohol dehydrogenase family)
MTMPVLDKFSLDGRVAIVTGASSGLGVAFARTLAEAGADVALGARRVDRLEETCRLVEDAGRRALAVATDVTKVDDCQNLVDTTMAEFGRVDVLVNNAGGGAAVPALRETPQQFLDVMDLNVNGSYWMAQACARVMEPGSSIVNISSVVGLSGIGLPMAAYAASKAAVIGLTRDLAEQWSERRGIRVNALAPGFFQTALTDAFTPAFAQQLKKRIVLGRLGDPDELAAALIFLASPASAYTTGQTLAVDGGMTIT